jgi:hypothetical protein
MYYIASISSLECKGHINCFKGSIFPQVKMICMPCYEKKMTIFSWFFSNIRRTITIKFFNISDTTWYIPITFCMWTVGYITFTKMQKKNSFWPETSFGHKISWPVTYVLNNTYFILNIILNGFSSLESRIRWRCQVWIRA